MQHRYLKTITLRQTIILWVFIFIFILPSVVFANSFHLFGLFGDRPLVPDDQVLQTLSSSSQQSLSMSSLKILVWNIYKGKKEGLTTDLENFITTSDVVLVQEWIQNEGLTKFASSIGNYQLTLAGCFWNIDKFITGVMTAAKAETISEAWVRSEHVEPFIKTPKMALLSSYRVSFLNQPVLFINIHGLNRTNTEKFMRQMEQIHEKIIAHSGPIVFAGDFNTRNKERMDFLEKYAADNSFSLVNFPNDPRKKKLDHILVRGLNIKQSKILTDVKTSDHFPLFVELN